MKKVLALLILLSTVIFSESLDDMKRKMENLNRGIEASTTRISNIDVEKEKTEDQIATLEKEIKTVEVEIRELNSQITSLSRRIDYSERSLRFSSGEELVKIDEYNAKLAAWNRARKHTADNIEFDKNKKKFKEVLYSDLDRMEQIRSVRKDLDLVRIDIEKDRRKLSGLKTKLVRKEKQNQNNRLKMSKLIKELEAEKKEHTTNISNSQLEMKKIEAEIDKIIRERSKHVKNVDLNTAKYRIGKLRKPVAGNYTTTFGQTKKGNVKSSGIEIRSQLGMTIRAATNGKVIYAGKFRGLGQVVMIDYGYNMIGIYGNLISVDVKVGENIKKADKVGILGLSVEGKPDLYYELRFNLKSMNPRVMF